MPIWHNVGRPGQPYSGYSITNGIITVIVPWQLKYKGVEKALEYLNGLENRREFTQPKSNRICVKCDKVIRKAHKWYINENRQIQHKHCERPEEYE